MISEYINSALQNKNSVMFITSFIFMAGIMSYFNDCGIAVAAIFTLAGMTLILLRRISAKYIFFWLFIFYLGFFNSYFRINTTDELYPLAPVDTEITGQIVSIPEYTKGRIRFFLDVNKAGETSLNAKTYVTITDNNNDDFGKLNIGDNVSIQGKLRQPFIAGNPSQFDYSKYLRNFNVFTTLYANKTDCKILESNLTLRWKFMRGLNEVRNRILESHAKYLKTPNLEILGGIVFGDDAVAPPDYIKADFINSGLLHILAASGMNVAFIFGFWFFIMRFFKVPYRINITGGMIMVILYTLMTGLGPSVLRAALMLLFIQAGKLIDRDAHSVSLLSFVAFLMLLYNPAYLNDVGFQLSFIVTFGLLTTGMVIFNRLNSLNLPEWLTGAVIIPVIAQIWVAPIQMFYFNTFSTYSILANILTVPFLSIISFGGFVSSILAAIQPIADFVCMVFDFVLKYALDAVVIISNYFAKLPDSLLQTTHPNIIQILIYYFIILLITVLIEIGLNKKIILTALSAVIILLISTINIPNNKLEIITFDVGNADAFLIKTPENKYFIIDTAKLSYKSSASTAKLVIAKYLKDRGIKNIEGMILTHFDLDHAGGAVDLMNELNIKNIYVNSFNKDTYTVNKIFNTIKEKNIKTHLAANNSEIYKENNLFIKTFIAGIKDNDNENSIITLLSCKDFDMLFMGDAGIQAFERIKQDIPHNIEVLKAGHHGGRNVVNKSMLEHLNSKVSIISTGPNTFGHPNKSTLDILRNTLIYRTDRHNSIKITTRGQDFEIFTFDRLTKKYKKSSETQLSTQ